MATSASESSEPVLVTTFPRIDKLNDPSKIHPKRSPIGSVFTPHSLGWKQKEVSMLHHSAYPQLANRQRHQLIGNTIGKSS